MNRIIKQAWPYANKYLDKAIFRDLMIPIIRGTSPALADFSFEKLDLGEIVCILTPFSLCLYSTMHFSFQPPRIGGVKVYTDNVRDQIMMDIEVLYVEKN